MKKKNKNKNVEEKNIETYQLTNEEILDYAEKEIIEENKKILESIAEANDRMNMVMLSLSDNGYIVQDGMISSIGDRGKAAFMPSIAFASAKNNDEPTAVALVPTINGGIRFAAPSEDGEYTKDLGHADLPCLIGTVEGPEGIYIPFSNPNACYIGSQILTNIVTGSLLDGAEDDDSISW